MVWGGDEVVIVLNIFVKMYCGTVVASFSEPRPRG